MNNVRLDGLFPTPVLTVERSEPYTMEEYDFVKNLSFESGPNNKVSIITNVLDHPEMYNLKNFFIESLNLFTEQVYLASNNELDISISWVNSIKPGKCHWTHKHKNAILSGVYYFESTEDCPLIISSPLENYNNIDFSVRREHNHFNSEEWILPTNGNTLIMFPAWAQHRVSTNNSNSTRYSLAWNAWFKKDRNYGYPEPKTLIKT
jgi:uncharacterized protein (TIGR02466 family)